MLGRLIILAESLTVACCADTAGDIIFLPYDIIPDAVYSLDICGVACEGCHVSHA